MAAPVFPLGRVVATPGALRLLADSGGDASELLDRHVRSDWGEVPPEDVCENELSVLQSFRIISSYPVGGAGERVWVVTEADRSSTCLLLPSEY